MAANYITSTQVGYRIRGIEPGDLHRYPADTRTMFWQWVVDFGLLAKDRDLAKGLDKDGAPMRRLKPKSIKYRKSEVGPTSKTAPPLEPSWKRSRVRSLLYGRAHADSAEFIWDYDAVSGDTFAVILRAQRDAYGRDVFGLSPKGVAATKAQAWYKWEKWKGKSGAKVEPKKRVTLGQAPVKLELMGRTDVKNMTLLGSKAQFQRAVLDGRTTGFRRLNVRGERWTPGHGLGGAPPKAPPTPKPAPRPPYRPIPTVTHEIIADSQASAAKIPPTIGPGVPSNLDLAGLVGAPRGATITAIKLKSGAIYVKAVGDGYEARVEIKGKTLDFTGLDVDDDKQGQGIATAILGRMITAANRAGLKRITMDASADEGRVGYLVFPKLGFDGPLPASIIAQLPEDLVGAKTVQDLYATALGRAWWSENGVTIALSLSL